MRLIQIVERRAAVRRAPLRAIVYEHPEELAPGYTREQLDAVDPPATAFSNRELPPGESTTRSERLVKLRADHGRAVREPLLEPGARVERIGRREAARAPYVQAVEEPAGWLNLPTPPLRVVVRHVEPRGEAGIDGGRAQVVEGSTRTLGRGGARRTGGPAPRGTPRIVIGEADGSVRAELLGPRGRRSSPRSSQRREPEYVAR